MDLINFENLKSEKSKALHWFHRFSFLFRATEIGVALLFFCWLFTCLPFAVKISGEFFRRFAYFVSTPLFMFFLGNSIIVALLTTKSTVFSGSGKIGGDDGTETDIYDAFIRSGENRVDGELTEEIVYDDKQIIATVTESNSNSTVAREDLTESENESKSVTDSAKVYRRTKSEISANHSPEMVSKPFLRRSETETYRKIIKSSEETPLDDNYPEDNLTNEEFQKTIEAFIKKQLIFRRQESLTVVIHNQI